MFSSVEEQVENIYVTTGLVIPRLTAGRQAFFEDIGKLLSEPTSTDDRTAYVLPDPSYSLPFPIVAENLTAQTVGSQSNALDESVGILLSEFGLPKDKLTQPIISLSSGERSLLLFARIKTISGQLSRVIACSPLHSLNSSRYHYWKKLVDHLKKRKIQVEVLALEGEPYFEPTDAADSPATNELSEIDWHLKMRDLVIGFPEVQYPMYHPASQIEYNDFDSENDPLKSPTLVYGDNGVGKTVFAKVLCRVLASPANSISISTPNGNEPCRLLFSEAEPQLFGKSINDHVDWAFRFDQTNKKHARQIYESMDKSLRSKISKSRKQYVSAIGNVNNPTTRLQAKLALAAERIATRPALLILDEPSRGLGRSLARLFLAIICQQAHEHNIPVLVISHARQWWHGITKSQLLFDRDVENTITICHTTIQ